MRKRQLELVHRANDVVEQLRSELPHLLAVAVVDVASGVSLTAYTSSAALDLPTVAKFQAGLVQRKQEALAALDLPGEQLEDILITLSSQLHLLRLTSTGERLISLVVDARTTNLALARDILRTRAEQLDVASGLRAA